MMRDQMISAEDFAIDIFGPDAELEIEDDGSAYITTPHGVIHVFFGFNGDAVARLTMFP